MLFKYKGKYYNEDLCTPDLGFQLLTFAIFNQTCRKHKSLHVQLKPALYLSLFPIPPFLLNRYHYYKHTTKIYHILCPQSKILHTTPD